jgi:hypothetical protein
MSDLHSTSRHYALIDLLYKAGGEASRQSPWISSQSFQSSISRSATCQVFLARLQPGGGKIVRDQRTLSYRVDVVALSFDVARSDVVADIVK